MKDAKIDSLQAFQKYVTIVFDEVKAKEGVVYDKYESRIVGFVDFGNVNNALLAFEMSLKGETGRPVVKHMLQFMVRGIFINLKKFRYARKRSVS